MEFSFKLLAFIAILKNSFALSSSKDLYESFLLRESISSSSSLILG